MEHKQFTSDDLDISIQSNQGFQVDRFTKKTSQLNIPDTIPENCSAELSGDCLKMEVPTITVNYFNSDDKENFNCSQQVLCNESLNNSTNIEIDNSYIRQCERKLFESSNSDDERNNDSGNKILVNSQLLKISKNFNDTISTPPSLLRKEINLLRTEIAETEEFHDLEIKLLKEEKLLNEMNPESNAELLEKYSTLMELYTNLKTSYEEYRKAQEKMGREFQSKTADCLESLCSQIEASDNSLNFSTASFVSFSGGVRSSTMMEDVSEVEATVVHEATVLANDPLSITADGTFKTPSQTPVRSVKKHFPANYSTSSKATVKEVKEILADTTTPLDSEYNIQLLNLETALYDKVTEVRDLEQRLLKIENVSSEMQSEFERISSVYATENNSLKESLALKTEQLNEITEKLFTEIISLNPSLKDSLVDVSGKKLLLVFIETIMESCKKLKANDVQATVVDLQNQLERKLLELEDMKKQCENLEQKLSDAENTVLTRDEEIRLLQSHLGDVRQTREHLASTKEALSELESRLTFEEAEKKAAENRCFELEETIQKLNRDIDASEKLRAELQSQLLSIEEEKLVMTNENSRLKELHEVLQLEMTETVQKLKSSEPEIAAIKESLSSADVTIQELKSQLKIMEEEKSSLQIQCSELQQANQKFLIEMAEMNSNQKTEAESEELKQKISEYEETVAQLSAELKSAGENNTRKIEELIREIEQLNNEKSELSKALGNVEESQRNFADLLADIERNNESLDERVNKLIENSLGEPVDTRDYKIITAFAETITKTYKGVQNELIKKFESEKHEWETQRELNLVSIKNLKDEINSLVEKRAEYEAKFSEISHEKEELLKMQENLKNQLAESKMVISTHNDEIRSREDVLKQTQDTLAAAEETIQGLKLQLSSAEAVKIEIEHRCRELEEIKLNLQADIDTKEGLLKEMNELKAARETAENENGDLKQKIQELGKEIDELRKCLQDAEEERNARELRMKESQSEIEQLKKETENLMHLTEKLGNLEKNKKCLMDVIAEVQKHLGMPEDALNKILSGDLEMCKVFIESIDNLVQKQVDELKAEREASDLEKNQTELEELRATRSDLESKLSESEKTITSLETTLKELRNGYSSVETKLLETQDTNSSLERQLEDLKTAFGILAARLSEAEKIISEREAEVLQLQSQAAQAREDFAGVKITLDDVESKLAAVETQKTDAEKQCLELEKTIENLNREIVEKENVRNVLEAQKTDAENRCRELEELAGNLQLEIDANLNIRTQLQTQLTMAEEKKLEMENESAHLKQSHDALKAQLAKAESDVALREEEIRILKSNESSLEKNVLEIVELKKSCQSLELKLLESNNAISVREEKILKLESDLAQAQEDRASDTETKEMELAQLKTFCSSLETKLSEAEKTNSHLEAKKVELEELKEVCSCLETKLSEVQQTVSDLEAKQIELDSLKEVCSSLETKLLDANKTISDLQKKLSEAEKTISQQEEEIRVLHLHVTQTREDFTKTKTNLAELESQLEATKAQKTDVENRYRELEGIIEDLNREMANKDNLLSELENQKSEFESENLRLKESFDSLKQQMTETETVISTRDEEIRELKTYECELVAAKEHLTTADETILRLKSQLQSIESEKSEMETRCTELQETNQNLRVEVDTAKNLENNPVYEKIQTENGDLRERILESERQMSELKAELEVAKKDQMNNICKVEELIREIEDLKRENDGFSCALSTIEETQKNLADVLFHPANDSDLPSDRITKLIGKALPDSAETRETKIVSDFVETITKTCKGVQNELIKKFDNKKLEWETQKDCDIQNLLDQIKLLNEKNSENEVALEQAKHELAEADEAILKLKSQLSSTEVEKVEIELRVTKLEENNLNLQAEIDTKETIIRGMDELKIVRQKIEEENGDLKQKIVESEEVIVRLKKSLEIVREEQIQKELKMKESENVIERLKKENAGLTDLTEKLDNLEMKNRNLTNFISEVRNLLDISENTMSKVLSGELETNKIFNEKLNNLIKTQMDGLQSENKHLRLGNDNLKEKVKQLTKLIGETASEAREELANLNASLSSSIILRSKPSRKSDMCARRLDKLEEINHNLTELINRMLTITEFPEPEKLKLYSVREFPNVMKKVVAHMNGLEEKMKEVKEENAQLDEECETYANIIKDLKKEAAAVWKTNKDKTEQMEAEMSRLREEKNDLENEKQDLLAKISKLEADCQKMKSSKSEVTTHNCACGNESKKVKELKRTILLKEQKLLELQDLEAQMSSYKAQIDYLKNALEREKKKIGEEKEKNKKLQNELNEATKNQKTEEKKSEENQVLDELRMRGSLSGGIVQEFVDKEKMRKLAKDIGVLKELCRARYAEIKRLEAVNAALRNSTPKNSNQMDSPIRTRGYNTRSKVQPRDLWKPEAAGKENSVL